MDQAPTSLAFESWDISGSLPGPDGDPWAGASRSGRLDVFVHNHGNALGRLPGRLILEGGDHLKDAAAVAGQYLHSSAAQTCLRRGERGDWRGPSAGGVTSGTRLLSGRAARSFLNALDMTAKIWT